MRFKGELQQENLGLLKISWRKKTKEEKQIHRSRQALNFMKYSRNLNMYVFI